jgi:quercetin dioxygenase-like cupin family protein
MLRGERRLASQAHFERRAAMGNGKSFWRTLLIAAAILSAAGVARGQDSGGHAPVRNVEQMKLGPFPGLPACATGAVVNGDPGKGPSIILSRTAKGCLIPWHWHTPNEHLMMVSGVARLDMKDGKPQTLRAGGFALMPSQHVHQFSCTSSCVFYVYSDKAFDIHYVDREGKEIPPQDALKQSRSRR